jgi:uncharacterized SAM-binding protein YcdF (DUF218 family)
MSQAIRTVIVIFGAAVRPDGTPSRVLQLRVETALEYGRPLERPIYVATGGVGRHGPAEAVVMAALLRAAGVADADVLEEPTARDTLDSVRAIRRLLGRHAGPVAAATSTYHQPRCVLLLRLAGYRAFACPMRVPATRDWRLRWFSRLKECVSLPWDVAISVVDLGVRQLRK